MPSSEASRGIAGRTAVVTGGARGIGEAIAAALCAAQAQVVIVDRDTAALERASARCGCAAVCGDLAIDPARVAQRVLDEYGSVELIVNNVGVTTRAGFRELDEAAFDLVIATNLRGPWFFTRRLVEALVADGRPGSVLFIGSLHAWHVRHFPHYSASKAAVRMLVRELAHELGPHGIRVNALAPGWIVADDRPMPEQAARLAPLGRLGRPGDVAPMAVTLLDDRLAGYVTGAELVVDGGLSLHSWLDDVQA